ncbi:MAG: LptF/LptG family permease, partial [Balneola sp.]
EKGFLLSENSEMLSLYLFDGNMQKFPATRSRSKTTVEISTFKEHRITFDLADLAFEKSDPKRRNRSDRTMNIQSMKIIVDSLSRDINNHFKDLLELRNTLPNLNVSELGSERKAIQNEDVQDTVLITNSLVANNLENIADQKSLFQATVTDLNNYKASLQNVQASINFRKKARNRYLVEIHKKFSIPFACIVFILLGAPIGIMTKRGNFGVAAIISTVILTFYWISLIQGEKLADRLFVTPFIGMWTFNVVFSFIGILLLIRLTTEFRLSDLFFKND